MSGAAGSGNQQRATTPQQRWDRSPLFRKLILAVIFWAVFMVLDRLSLAFQMLGGTPAWYLPAGLNWALVLGVGIEFTPAVFAATITSALWNYHRGALAWTVVPGNLAICLTYAAGALLLRNKWRLGLRLERLRDVGRPVAVLLAIEAIGAFGGVWAELADGLLPHAEFLRGTFEWWVSDAISIVSFTPFLLLYVAPWARSWTTDRSSREAASASVRPFSASPAFLEQVLQFVSITLAIWLVFGFKPTARYQPLYLLFVPVIWITVRHGLRKASIAGFIINAAVMVAAQLVHTETAALPGLQLLMLVLGSTALCVGAVVNESMRAQEALRRSEDKYRSLIANIPDVTWSSAVDGRTHYISANVEQVFGFTSEEICEKDAELWLGRIHQDDSKRIAQALQQLFAEGKPFDVEYRVQRKDGQWIWVHDRAYRTYVRDGVQYADGVFSDITKRRRAEEDLRRSEAYLAESQRLSHTGSWAWKLSSGELYWADETFRIFGFDPAKTKASLHDTFLCRIHPEDRSRIEEGLNAAADRRSKAEADYRIVLPDGSVRHLHEVVYPIADESGEVFERFGVVSDITERRRAEKELRLTQSSVEHASDAVFWTDPQGRIVYVNEAACRSLGRCREELLSLSVPDIDPLFPKEVWELNWEKQRALGAIIFESKHQTKQGRVFPVEITANYVELDGQAYSFAFARDITERRRAEEAIRESEQRYSLLFSQMVVGFALLEVIYDENGKPCDHRYLELNSAFETHSGLARERVLGRTIREVLPNIEPFWIETYGRVATSGESVHFESYAQPLHKWFEVTAFRTRPGQLGVTFADITESKRAEEALSHERNLLRTLIDNLPDCVYVKDTESRFLIANTGVARVMGVEKGEDVLGRTDFDFCPNELAAKYRSAEQEVIRSGQPMINAEETTLDASGNKGWHLTTKVPLRNALGDIVGLVGIGRDITERKQTDERLRKLSLAVEQSPASVVITDVRGNIEYVNPKFTQLTGYTAEEAIGQNPRILKSELQSPSAYRELWETILSGGEWRGELANRKKNGEIYWESVSIVSIKDCDNAITHFLAVKEDISERKRAEQALVQTKEKYRSLVYNIPDVVWSVDSAGKFAFMSPNIENVSGYGIGEIEQGGAQFFFETIHPDDREKVKASMDGLFSRGEPFDVECRARRKSGDWIWVHDRGVATYERDGVRYADGLLSDITARKRAEEEILFKTALLEAESEATIDGVLAVDETGKVALTNRQFRLMFGVSDELLNTREDARLLQCVTQQVEDGDAFVKRVLHLYGHPEDKSRDEVTLKDGRILDRYSAPLVYPNGRYGGRIWYFRDITERKRAEEELRKAKEVAEAASRIKSEFLANMSHEIRTPMNGIMGMTELVLDTALTPEQREDLDTIKASADSLLGIINDILDFSKIEAGKLNLERIEFNLKESVSTAIKTLGLRAAQKNLHLASQWDAAVPGAVLGDPGRLRQVLINLVGNAIKFTEHGEIVVRVEKLSEVAEETDVHFSVSDTGIGIPPEKLKSVFDPFVQADSSSTRRFGGTGLGLSICKQLVSLMGGRVWAESEVGRGSTFHFTARLGVPALQVVRPVRANTSTVRGLSVLAVADDESDRRLIEGILRGWEMKPTTVGTVSEARALLDQDRTAGEQFALIALDIHAADVDGFELARQIKQEQGLADTPMMMLTSVGRRGDASRCRDLGISAYLIKPVSEADLLEAILQVLGPGKATGAGQPQLITRHSLREGRKHLRILVVEDNPVGRHLAVRLVEKQGHSTMTAASGREALAVLEREKFDLVLMDVQMPEMDGFEATAAIRRKEAGTAVHLPIVALTAHAMQGDRDRCLEAGMDAYLTKPLQLKELFALLEGVSAKLTPAEKPRHT